MLTRSMPTFNNLQQTPVSVAPRLVPHPQGKQNKVLHLCENQISIQNFEDTWRVLLKSAKENLPEPNPFMGVWLHLKTRFYVLTTSNNTL